MTERTPHETMLKGFLKLGKSEGVNAWNGYRRRNRSVVPYLNGADLEGAYLRAIDFSGAYLQHANLNGAYLRRAQMRNAALNEAMFKGANLGGADLGGAYLRGALLDGATLSGVNLAGAYLLEARGLIAVPGDRWVFYFVAWSDGPRVAAGCHWFTVTEALERWSSDANHDRMSRTAIECGLALAKVRGWEVAA